MIKNYLVIFAVLILLVVMIVPAQAANANLFVSAENSKFNNYMSGSQVIEVVVIDSSISDTDMAKPEPDVTVNGKKLRMAQATDGNWYAYFADKTMAQLADSTVTSAGRGLDFGQFCSSVSTALSTDGTALFTDTSGVAIPIRTNGIGYGVNGTSTITACNTTFTGHSSGTGITIITANSTHTGSTAVSGVEGRVSDVVREAKTINSFLSTISTGIGQIKLKDEGLWPLVQLYTLPQSGNVIVQYNKGGSVQSTTLTFDTVQQFAKISLDKTMYTQGSQVHATITDLWLNIDPTDEDSWTFSANATNTATFGSYYNVFNENGGQSGDSNTATLATPLLSKATLQSLMCEENCLVSLNPDNQNRGTFVVSIQDNADSAVTAGNNIVVAATNGAKLIRNTVPVTFTEISANSAIFGSDDENNISSLKITDDAKHETTATIAYVQTQIIKVVDFAMINTAPTANDHLVTTNEDTQISFKLTANDPENNPLQYSVVTNPLHGTLFGTAPNLTYTPTLNYFGTDTFTFKANDGKLDSGIVIVTIGVTAVQDIPVANAGIEQSVNVGATVQLDGSKSIDGDNDSITYSWIQTAGYPVTLTSNTIANPKFTAPNTNGQLTFMLTVSDGKATSNPAIVNVYVGSIVPVPVPPPSPTSITATASNGAVQLKWSPPAKDGGASINDYVIEYKQTSDNTWKTYDDGKSPNTSSTVSGLKNDASYQFRVSAVNSAGVGEKSSSINAIPKITHDVAKPDGKKPDGTKKVDDKKAAEKKALADKKTVDAKKIADAKRAEKIKIAKEKAKERAEKIKIAKEKAKERAEAKKAKK